MFRIVLVALSLFGLAHAQNNAGVFGPIVNEGRKVFEYRYAVADPLDNAPDDAWSQRVHYEHAFNGRFMGRIGAQWRDSPTQDEAEFQFARVMLFMEIGEVREGWTTGLRFDARVRDGDGSDEIAISSTNQFDFGPKTFARANFMFRQQIGDGAPDAPVLETRSGIFHRFDSGITGGLELYNTYGEIGSFNDFDDQAHEIAPALFLPLGGKFTLYTSMGYGLSDRVADSNFRIRVIRDF